MNAVPLNLPLKGTKARSVSKNIHLIMRYSLSTSNRLHQVHQAKLRASANFKIYQDFRRPINSSNPFSLNLAIIIQIIKKKHFSLIAYLNKKKKSCFLNSRNRIEITYSLQSNEFPKKEKKKFVESSTHNYNQLGRSSSTDGI